MTLTEIHTKSGNSLQIISKGESSLILNKIKESLEARTFVEMVLKDDDVLKLLCNHRSTLSSFEQFSYPLLFSIKRDKKTKSNADRRPYWYTRS